MIIKPWPDFSGEIDNSIYEDYKIPPRIIYHYTSVEVALKIIEGHKLKFSSADEFNDPFDMYEGLIDPTGTRKQYRDWIKVNIPGTRDERRRIEEASWAGGLYKEGTILGLNKLKQASGICCFSKIADQTLMWSHYARSHKGVCLGFNIQPFVVNGDFIVFEVKYPKVITTVNYYTDRDILLRHLYLTKMKAWEYEQEVRAIIRDRKSKTFFDFDKECLKEIYFGYSTPKSQVDAILQALDKHDYNLISKNKMVLDKEKFVLHATTL